MIKVGSGFSKRIEEMTVAEEITRTGVIVVDFQADFTKF
jgi:hypothetical protein